MRRRHNRDCGTGGVTCSGEGAYVHATIKDCAGGVTCSGDEACDSATIEDCSTGGVTCSGKEACFLATITRSGDVACSGPLDACAGATITGCGNVVCDGTGSSSQFAPCGSVGSSATTIKTNCLECVDGGCNHSPFTVIVPIGRDTFSNFKSPDGFLGACAKFAPGDSGESEDSGDSGIDVGVER